MSDRPHRPTLLVTVAHPDDESFGCGSVIATAAALGWPVVVCCASRGEAGEDTSGRHPTPESLGMAREAELREAAATLGAADVELLGFADSGWDGPAPAGSLVADPAGLRAAVADVLGRHRPDVVVTLDPTGSDGHRDHAMIGMTTTQAFEEVVDWPASLYHWFLPRSLMAQWAAEVSGRDPDSVYLETELGRPDGDVTTVIDASAVLDQRWAAIGVHETQRSPYEGISPELAARFVGLDHLVRVVPPWEGGEPERALFVPAAAPNPAWPTPHSR
ncbi:MAG: PIG-L deacetylase family protein [Intrasporangium sp.]|uniref:PIG-L deacetylase family protein n=1 Tax=Intrasporangium sp. TaxID=1925024 RepID=UPI003F7FFF15